MLKLKLKKSIENKNLRVSAVNCSITHVKYRILRFLGNQFIYTSQKSLQTAYTQNRIYTHFFPCVYMKMVILKPRAARTKQLSAYMFIYRRPKRPAMVRDWFLVILWDG